MKKKPISKRGYVATSVPGQKRWRQGEIKICDCCGVAAPWTSDYFYRRYGDDFAREHGYENGDTMAKAQGYEANLQPHCHKCTTKTRKESAAKNGTK